MSGRSNSGDASSREWRKQKSPALSYRHALCVCGARRDAMLGISVRVVCTCESEYSALHALSGGFKRIFHEDSCNRVHAGVVQIY